MTTTAAQKEAIMEGAAANIDIGSYDLRASTLTADSLTSGRVPFASTSGLLVDGADFSFATDTLTVTKLGAYEQAGAVDFSDEIMTNVNVDSGAMDGTVIGANSAAAGTFAAVVGTSLNVSDGNITNVGSISLDSIAADDGSSFSFGSNWTAASRTCANLGTVSAATSVTSTTFTDGTATLTGGALTGLTALGENGTPVTNIYASNVYTGDFHMKNERGDWTLFEESDHIRIKNNTTGQVFKMAMTLVDEE